LIGVPLILAEGCGAGSGAELDASRRQELQGLVAARGLDPVDPDAIELFLKPTLVLEDQAHRVVVGPVDGDLLDGAGLAFAPAAGYADDHRDEQYGAQTKALPASGCVVDRPGAWAGIVRSHDVHSLLIQSREDAGKRCSRVVASQECERRASDSGRITREFRHMHMWARLVMKAGTVA
jgi:hypothetical protein